MTDDERIKELYEAHKKRESNKSRFITITVIVVIATCLLWTYHRGSTGVNGGPDPTGCSSAQADSGAGLGC